MLKAPTATVWNEDCVRGMAERLKPDSIHLTVTSIPFEELFTYSGKLEDVGNNGSTVDIRAGRFALNMRFVVEQLFRVTAPGCNVCIHIQQLLAYKNQHGFMGRRDFRGGMADVFGAGGFHWIGEFAIRKNPQAMAQRLKLHSLQFKTGKVGNGCNLAPAINDYVLIFQKPGESSHPVRCLRDVSPIMLTEEEYAEENPNEYSKDGVPVGYQEYCDWFQDNKSKFGGTNPRGWLTTNEWIRDAHGTWTDIQEIDILDGYKSARESDEEKHVCPLQLSVIYRLIRLYTNPISIQPNVKILDPFMGIGSTAWVAIGGNCMDGRLPIGHERNVVGFELKESYHDQAERNIAKAMRQRKRIEQDATPLFRDFTEEPTAEDAVCEAVA
jgi:hypothetical protein